MIADEVICGFGRLGRLFGSEVYGIEPDLVTVAKGLTSGYFPLSAVIALRAGVVGAPGRVARGRRLRPRLHLQRASGRARRPRWPTSTSCSARTWSGTPRGPAPTSQAALRERVAGLPLVGDVRGVGLMAGIELVADRASRRPFERRAEGRPAGRGPVPRGRPDRPRAAGGPRHRAVAAALHHAGAGGPRGGRPRPRGSGPSATTSRDRARGRPPSARDPGGRRGGPPRRRPTARSRSSSSTAPATGTGPCPKGKIEPGESDEECALREVAEETGFECLLGPEIGESRYRERRGRDEGGSLLGHDRPGRRRSSRTRRWTRSAGSRCRARRASSPTPATARSLTRSSRRSGRSSSWCGTRGRATATNGPATTALRPLDKRGRRQADAMVGAAGGLPAHPARLEPVRPLRRRPSSRSPRASDCPSSTTRRSPKAFRPRRRARCSTRLGPGPVVLCTHGDVVEALVGEGEPKKKGSTWLLAQAERRRRAGPLLASARLTPRRG